MTCVTGIVTFTRVSWLLKTLHIRLKQLGKTGKFRFPMERHGTALHGCSVWQHDTCHATPYVSDFTWPCHFCFLGGPLHLHHTTWARTWNIIWILYTRPHAQRPHPHGQGAHFNILKVWPVPSASLVLALCAAGCTIFMGDFPPAFYCFAVKMLATLSHSILQKGPKKQFTHCNLPPFTVAYFNLMNNRQWAGWVSECIQVTLSQYQPPSVAVPPLLSWLSRRGGAGNCFIMQ